MRLRTISHIAIFITMTAITIMLYLMGALQSKFEWTLWGLCFVLANLPARYDPAIWLKEKLIGEDKR
jgi:hypothetical protein